MTTTKTVHDSLLETPPADYVAQPKENTTMTEETKKPFSWKACVENVKKVILGVLAAILAPLAIVGGLAIAAAIAVGVALTIIAPASIAVAALLWVFTVIGA